MAQPEVDIEGLVSEVVRFLLNIFPRPAKAKLIRVRMISFFIVCSSYQVTRREA